MLPLIKADLGKYRIVSIDNACPGARKRLTLLGVFAGDEIEVIKSAPGPVIFKKDGTRIGVGQGMADDIMVEKSVERRTPRP